MHDFHCSRAEDIHSGVLARRVYELKETQGGVDVMCSEMDAIYREGERVGEVRGELKKARETVFELAGRGVIVTDIADIVKIHVNLVREWLSEA